MSKSYTEREYVLAQRKAFERGAQYVAESKPWRDCHPDSIRLAAASQYDLQKVTRPRVAKDPDQEPFEWAVINGQLKVRNPEAQTALIAREWGRANGSDFGAFEPTAARVKVWSDLLARPTEEVDDE